MTYDRVSLEADIAGGATPDFLLFWGHQPSKDGSITATCFSQWWPSPFEIDGVAYATAEHWMMAEKARLSGDHDAVAPIIDAGTPKQAKELGRKIRGFDAALWDERKREIVIQGNRAKFEQNTELKAFLLGTGNAVIVEASPVDPIWGIGLAANDPDARDPSRWRGENLLGFALMDVRDTLREPATA